MKVSKYARTEIARRIEDKRKQEPENKKITSVDDDKSCSVLEFSISTVNCNEQ